MAKHFLLACCSFALLYINSASLSSSANIIYNSLVQHGFIKFFHYPPTISLLFSPMRLELEMQWMDGNHNHGPVKPYFVDSMRVAYQELLG